MKIPNLTIQQLLEAGVHLGHKTLRWNPKMKKYIFGKRDSIHIIDLTQTLELTKIALEKIYETIANNGKILLCTKTIVVTAIGCLIIGFSVFVVNITFLLFMVPKIKLKPKTYMLDFGCAWTVWAKRISTLTPLKNP